jgi:hypothetical protein
MNTKLAFTVLVLATILVSIDAHGYMSDPMNRGSVYRLNNPAFPRSVFIQTDDNEWCAMKNDPFEMNLKCGVCGPIYNNDPSYFGPFHHRGRNITVTSYERDSFHFSKVPSMSQYIVKTYKRGQLISPRVKVKI